MAAPELSTDLIGEIIVRLPPADPTCLVRASLVCKLWNVVISDPTFPRRYGAFHGDPPLLGSFHTVYGGGGGGPIPRFVPITEPSPFPQPGPDFRDWRVVDCRHGRVLLDHRRGSRFAVWDPISGHRDELDYPGVPDVFYTAAVLRGGHGHGFSFLVVMVYPDYAARLMLARVFSSKTGAWGAPASADNSGAESIFTMRGSIAVADAIYFILVSGVILKYDIGKHELNAIESPGWYGTRSVLMAMEDGTLGLAGTDNNSILRLWSRKVNSDGVARWVQCRVIELQKLIPVPNNVHAIGFAEDVGVIFLTNGVGTFMIELKSGWVKRVIQRNYYFAVFPFRGFSIPRTVLPALNLRDCNFSDCSSGRLTLPAGSN